MNAVLTTKRSNNNRRRRARRGFSLLEFEVALIVLGIALSGMFPLVVMHSRGMRFLEERYAVTGQWYFSASPDIWIQKLGAPATLVRENPDLLPVITEITDYQVKIISFERSLDSETVSAYVSVAALPE